MSSRSTPAEAREPELAQARAQSLAGQFIFDVQTHFVRDDFEHKELLDLAKFARRALEPEAARASPSLARYKFQNFVKEIYYDSDTNLALLSGAPFDDPTWWFLSNEQIVKARELLNDFAGSKRLLAHTVITPKQPGWMDEVDKAIAVYKPDSWKGYTIGDPLSPVEVPVAARRREADVSVLRKGGEGGDHHDLHPQGPAAARLREGVRRRLGIRHRLGHRQGRQGLAADELRDVPLLPAPVLELPDQAWTEFEQTGRIRWATDLAEIPQKFGVTNVYAELGTVVRQLGRGASEVLLPR